MSYSKKKRELRDFESFLDGIQSRLQQKEAARAAGLESGQTEGDFDGSDSDGSSDDQTYK